MSRLHIPPRDRSKVVIARPAPVVEAEQAWRAFAIVFRRYHAAFKELSKR